LTALSLFAQNPAPTATPVTADENDVVKISTTLIQVDVSVTDSRGNIVGGLTADDFEIFENGKKQDITNFSFISAGARQNQVAEKTTDKTGVPIPPTAVRPEQVRRTFALVVDDLTLSFESTYYVRRALKKFVDEQMQDGDLVAIIRTGGGIGALQQFTTDKRMLYAAIEKVQWKPFGSGGISAFAPIEATPLERAKANGAEVSDEAIEAEKNFIAGESNFREDIFATGTLGAINYIVRGMRELPGRKSVMLLSDGFQLFSRDASGFTSGSRVLDSLRRLVDLANRSSVVIYTLDARGLQTLGASAADDFSSISPEGIEQRLSERRDTLFNTQEGLTYLAKQTGGFAVLNNNDLNRGITNVMKDQSYYLIGYQPAEEVFDPKNRAFNRLEVKVKRPGVTVRFRSGFFGIADENMDRPKNLTPYQQITAALTSPFAINDISLSLNTVFRGDTKNRLFINSFLYISIKDLKFVDEANGDKKAVFDLMAMSFGDNGNPADSFSKTYTIRLKNETYRQLLNEGFIYNFTFPIKKAGAYQMRVAIRDHATEQVGSANQFIEVPRLDRKRLTLSGIIVENMSRELWGVDENTVSPDPKLKNPDPLADTAVRVFKRGTVLRYGFEIYNAKFTSSQKPQLQMQTRIFRNGEIVHTGNATPVDLTGQTDLQIVKAVGALSLGTEMETGDYVLQIIIIDSLAKKNNQVASQFVQFEVVD
jgi:VWFA-related protein